VNNDGKSAQYMAVNKKLDNGWQVYATATQAKAGITVLIYMVLGLIWALLALMLARGLAPLYGEVVVQPLQKLEESLEVFDAARTITIMPPAPNDAPQEIRQAYARVRESMQNSRDAYRNMLKVINEGNDLRNKLRSMSGSGSGSQKIRAVKPNHGDKQDAISEDSLEALGSNDETIVAERIAGGPKLEMAQDESTSGEYSAGGHDSVTGLPGQDVFEGFFGEAWTLGVSDSRPISVIVVRVDETDNKRLGLVADKLKVTAARTLDLVARITKWDFGLVLPDADLEGALTLAGRLHEELQEQDVVISFGVASIVPNNNGNAQSFLDICNRAVAAARKKGDGQIAFVSDKGKLMLHSVPEAPDKNSKFDMIDWDTGEEASA
jgi:GGDEF domain-containing protein